MGETIRIAYGNTVKVALSKLNDLQGSLKKLSEENYQKLRQEIIETGFAFAPHVWPDANGKLWLVDGHQRIATLRRMAEDGMKIPSIPVVPVQAKSLREAKRRILQGVSQYGHIQEDGLKEFLDAAKFDFDFKDRFDLPGVDLPEFVSEHFRSAADMAKDLIEDEVPEIPKNVFVKPGELYLLGNHRLLCGDSTDIEHMDRLMNDERADLVFTDPPYGVNYDGGHATDQRREKLANDTDTTIYDGAVPMMSRFSKDNAALYLWFAATKSLQVLQVLQTNGYEIRSWLIWNKNVAQFGAIGAQYKQKHEPCLYAYKKGKTPFWCGPTNEVSVWDVSRASKNEYHPTQKPVELASRAILNSSPEKGVVLDLFGGSGATLVGCEKHDRRGYLMELDPGYCQVILDRWAAYSGKDPVRDDGKSWLAVKNEKPKKVTKRNRS